MRSRFGFKLALVFAIAAFALTGSTLFAQAGGPARRITAGADLPATCISSVVIRDIFYKSGSNSGIYVCTAADTWTLQQSLADVVGPASSTNNAIAVWDGTTGKLLKNSTVTIVSGTVTIPQGSSINQTSVGTSDGMMLQARNSGWAMLDIDAGNVWALLSVASVTADRTYTLPDASGTFTLGGNTFSGTDSVVRSTSPTIATPTITGAIPTYNSITTAGLGLAPIVAVVSLTAQEAAITTTNLLTAPTPGTYRVSWYHEVTQAATSSSATQVTLAWTAAAAQSTAGTNVNTNVVGAFSRNLLVVRVASGDLTYAVSYTSSGATPMQYAVYVVVERLQ